jgi:hypothetical protein
MAADITAPANAPLRRIREHELREFMPPTEQVSSPPDTYVR